MKKIRSTHLLLIGLVTMFVSTALARRVRWESRSKPPILLQEAVDIAQADLNEGGKDFYCLGATIAKTFSTADWELTFGTKEGDMIWINVAADKSLRKSEGGFNY